MIDLTVPLFFELQRADMVILLPSRNTSIAMCDLSPLPSLTRNSAPSVIAIFDSLRFRLFGLCLVCHKSSDLGSTSAK
jgi:hypothetical protein